MLQVRWVRWLLVKLEGDCDRLVICILVLAVSSSGKDRIIYNVLVVQSGLGVDNKIRAVSFSGKERIL